MVNTPTTRLVQRVAAATAALALPAMAIATVPAHAGEDSDDTADVDRLTVATAQSVDTFNPFLARYVIEYTTRHMVYETLVRSSAEDYSFEPGLATDWEESDDGLTWTFTIRDDSQWSDGEPVTAHDVAFTFQTMMDVEAYAGANADFVSILESVEATDDHTVVFTVTEPTTQLMTGASDYSIVPQHIWADIDNPGEYLNDDFPLVGSGPFQIVEYETDQFIRMEANENYWAGAPGFDELVFRYYTEPDAQIAALETGEVDIVGFGAITPAQYAALQDHENIDVINAQNRRWVSLVFNVGARTIDGEEFGTGHPALKDPEVRRALHHAIDKPQLVETVLDGFGDPGVSIVPKIFETFHWDPGEDERVSFDLDQARQILDDAGYEMGADGIRETPDGEPLEFRLFYHADNAYYASIVQFLEEWWEEIGLAIEVTPIDGPVLNDNVYAGDYDIAFSGWGVGPDPTSILAMHTCEVLPTEAGDISQRSHETFYCNPEYDDLHEQQKGETDVNARAELIKQQQQILYDDAPVIWLYYQNTLEAYRSDRVSNLTPQPADNGMITGQQSFMWAFHSATPAGGGSSGDGMGPVTITVGAAVVAVGVLAGVALAVRRRRTAEERE